MDPLFQRIRHERQGLLTFVQEKHNAEVPESFVGEAGACDQLETLNLAKVGRRPKHVNVEQFRDVVVARKRVLFLE